MWPGLIFPQEREEHRGGLGWSRKPPELNKTVAILVDTQGPEVRTPLEAGEVILKEARSLF